MRTIRVVVKMYALKAWVTFTSLCLGHNVHFLSDCLYCFAPLPLKPRSSIVSISFRSLHPLDQDREQNTQLIDRLPTDCFDHGVEVCTMVSQCFLETDGSETDRFPSRTDEANLASSQFMLCVFVGTNRHFHPSPALPVLRR